MDSFADRPQSPSPHRGSFPGGKGLAWLAGVFLAAVATLLTTILAVALAASVVVIAVMGAALLLLATLGMRAKRTVKARASSSGAPLLEARHLGGHSWVAYGWDRRQ